jgi:tRNA uridine 5-carboxymethylaminomethyl modification enzyme
MTSFDKVKSYIEENDLDQEILEQAEIQVKYSGYIDKEKKQCG